MCFRRIRTSKDFLWTKTIVSNKAQKVKLSNGKGYSILCHSKTGKLYCKQLKHTKTFSSVVTKSTYNFYNKLNCESSYLIYLMECAQTKRQYAGESETTFNISLNNHLMTYIKPTRQELTNILHYPDIFPIDTQSLLLQNS